MKEFVARQRAQFRSFKQERPYLGTLAQSSPVVLGFSTAFWVFASPLTALAVGTFYTATYNSVALGDGLVRARAAAERRAPRLSRAVQRTGLGRLPWTTTWFGALVVGLVASFTGFVGLTTAAIGVAAALTPMAVAQTSVASFKKAVLRRNSAKVGGPALPTTGDGVTQIDSPTVDSPRVGNAPAPQAPAITRNLVGTNMRVASVRLVTPATNSAPTARPIERGGLGD